MIPGPDSQRHSISDRTVNTGALLIAQIHGSLLVLLHNVDAHNVNVTGRVCYLM